MKKNFLGIFIATLLIFTIGCGSVSENQREEPIFAGKADALIGNLKIFAANGNFELSEPKTSTSGNEKYCTLSFGGSNKTELKLKLNSDDSVVNEEIIINDANSYELGKMAGMLLSGTLAGIGVEQAEMEKFLTSYQKAVAEEIRKQNNASTPTIDQTHKVYCAANKKDLNVSIEADDKHMRYLIEVAK